MSAITNPQVSHDANHLNLQFHYTGTWTAFKVFIDTDNNPGTGQSIAGIGANFKAEANNLSSGGPNWAGAGGAGFSNAGGVASWSISRSALGLSANEGTIQVVFQVSGSSGKENSPKVTHSFGAVAGNLGMAGHMK